MLVTMSGPPGSGTSTAAAELSERLGLKHVSGGDIFRELAAERDMTVEEFNTLAETDDQIDLDLDERLRAIAIERDDLVLESRLSGWMAGEYADMRIWLDAPIAVRAERIAEREDWTPAEAIDRTEMREESERRRYAHYYDIDIADLRIYDLTLNTAKWGIDEEMALLTQAVESYRTDTDAGQMPIQGIRYAFE